MVVDPESLFCQWHALCRGDDGVGHHVLTSGYIEYGYRPVYQLALLALGHQAFLESAGRYSQDQESLDRSDAVAGRGGSGWCGADYPGR